MKLDSGLTPAVALYKESSGPAVNAIAQAYEREVDQDAFRTIALAAAK